MSVELPTRIVVTPEGEEVSSLDVQEGKHHCLRVETELGNGDVIFNFSTRRAMYDFAVSLLQEAVYGRSGQQEFCPLGADGKWLVVNGVRMSEDSSRLFVFYENASDVSPS
jgi:hypothetical protein